MGTEEEEEEDVKQLDDKDYEGAVFTQKDVLFNLQDKGGIPSSWILLNNQMTVDVFCNSKMI